MKPLLAVLPLVLLGACSLGGDPDADSSPTPSASSSAPSAPSSSPSDAPSTQPDASGTPACAEVRAGIDDFNTGDFQGTVEHFRKAVPLARTQAEDDDSSAASDLVEAVEYYADLAPEDYPMASSTSPDFAKYKAITLAQCAGGQEAPQQPEESGSPGITT